LNTLPGLNTDAGGNMDEQTDGQQVSDIKSGQKHIEMKSV